MKTMLATAATLLLATAVAAQETDETTMTMEDVPAAVMEAATANAGGLTFEAVAMDDGVYEFSTTMESGMGMEVDVMEDGSIEEIETQIDIAELPAEVAATVATELAGAELTYIEKSERPEGVVVYEFEGMMDGANVDAEINADGTGFAMADDAAG